MPYRSLHAAGTRDVVFRMGRTSISQWQGSWGHCMASVAALQAGASIDWQVWQSLIVSQLVDSLPQTIGALTLMPFHVCSPGA
eukprot:10106044-Alexandrium_andersonii.AAC.1